MAAPVNLLNSYTNRMLYDAGGFTGNDYYIYIKEKDSNLTWNNINEELQVDPNREEIAIDLVEIGTSGCYPIVIPDNVPTGKIYDVVVCLKAAAAPAETDDVQTTYVLSHGSIFGF